MKIQLVLSILAMGMLVACSSGGGGGGGAGPAGGSDPTNTNPTPPPEEGGGTPTPAPTVAPTAAPTATPIPTDPKFKEAFFKFLDSLNTVYSAVDNAEKGKAAPLKESSADQQKIETTMTDNFIKNCTLKADRDANSGVAYNLAASGNKCPVVHNYATVNDEEKNPVTTLTWGYSANSGFKNTNDVSGLDVKNETNLSLPPGAKDDSVIYLDQTGGGNVTSNANGTVKEELNEHLVFVKGSDGKYSLKEGTIKFTHTFKNDKMETVLTLVTNPDGELGGSLTFNGTDATQAEGDKIFVRFGQLGL